MAIIEFSSNIGDNPKPLRFEPTVIGEKQQNNKEKTMNNDDLELKKIKDDIKEKKEQLKTLEEEVLEKKKILENLEKSILEKESFLISLEEKKLDDISNLNSTKKAKNSDIKSIPINEWKSRKLESMYSLVFIDMVNFKLKKEDREVTKYIYSLLGIDINGKRDVLGVWIFNKDIPRNVLDIFQEIKSNGVEDILIISTPLREVYKKEILKVFPKSKIEISILEEIKSSRKYVNYKDLKSFNNDLKKIYLASTEYVAWGEFEELDDKWGEKYPIVIKIWEDKLEDLDMVFKYPEEIRNILYGSNILRLYNSKLNKITKKDFNNSSNDEIINDIYIEISELLYKWKEPLRGWVKVLSKLSILFKDRVNRELL